MKTDRILRALVPCACASLLVCGCNEVKEQPEEPYTGIVSVSVTASSGSPDTKVTLTHDRENFQLNPAWEKNDRLHIAGAKSGYLGYLTLKGDGSSQTAEFTGSLKSWSEAQIIHAYYLGSNPDISGDICTVSANAQIGTLNEKDGGVAHKYCFMHAGTDKEIEPKESVDLGSLTLENSMSVLYLDFNQTFKEGTTITCSDITVSGSLDLKTGTLNASSTGKVTLSGASSTYYMAILPGKQKLKFEGTPKSGSGSVDKTMNEITFAANKFYTSHGDSILVADRTRGSELDDLEVTDKVLTCPDITNKGNAYVYVRAAIVGYWENSSGEQVAAWESTDGTFVGLTTTSASTVTGSVKPRTKGAEYWVKGTDGYYYYTVPLQPGESTPKLFDTYTADGTVHVSGSNLCLHVLVQMVDYDKDRKNAEEAWGSGVAGTLYILTL